MSLSSFVEDDYPDPTVQTPSHEHQAASGEPSMIPQSLGISPGDPRMLPFPMNVAACVLITAIEDLRAADKKRRSDARYCVRQGWLEPWVDRLDLDDAATERVLDLLDDLAAGRPQY